MLLNEAESERTVYACAAPAFGLVNFCFFARRDDFGVARIVGQAGSLRPIVNRPVRPERKAPGRRVANPPQDDILPHGEAICESEDVQIRS
jgi:hypothetical protein